MKYLNMNLRCCRFYSILQKAKIFCLVLSCVLYSLITLACTNKSTNADLENFDMPNPENKQKIFVNTTEHDTAQTIAQHSSEPVWVYLQQAKRAFDTGLVSDAVKLANEAKDINRTQYTELINKLRRFLDYFHYKIENTSITSLYNALYDHDEIELCKNLDAVFKLRSIKQMSNSLEHLFDFLADCAQALPESDYIIGKVFQTQGEYKQAQLYLERAWHDKDFLENQNEKIIVLSALAEIAESLQDPDTEEMYLLAILSEDSLFGEKNKASSKFSAMLKSILNQKNLEKFFLLYRHQEINQLAAYNKLTEHYIKNEKYEKALETAACAVCIITTHIEEYVKRAHFLFEYTSIDDLLSQASKDADLCEWAQKQGFWEAYIRFADILYELELYSQAEDVYASVASAVPDFYIARRAFYAIQKIRFYYAEQSVNETNDE